MGITDFSGKSKDEIIEYLIDEHNATERETAQLRQELAVDCQVKLTHFYT